MPSPMAVRRSCRGKGISIERQFIIVAAGHGWQKKDYGSRTSMFCLGPCCRLFGIDIGRMTTGETYFHIYPFPIPRISKPTSLITRPRSPHWLLCCFHNCVLVVVKLASLQIDPLFGNCLNLTRKTYLLPYFMNCDFYPLKYNYTFLHYWITVFIGFLLLHIVLNIFWPFRLLQIRWIQIRWIFNDLILYYSLRTLLGH